MDTTTNASAPLLLVFMNKREPHFSGSDTLTVPVQSVVGIFDTLRVEVASPEEADRLARELGWWEPDEVLLNVPVRNGLWRAAGCGWADWEVRPNPAR